MPKPRECRYCGKPMEPLKPGELLRDNDCCSDECREECFLQVLLSDDGKEWDEASDG